jgi:hypothetical protein
MNHTGSSVKKANIHATSNSTATKDAVEGGIMAAVGNWQVRVGPPQEL